MTRFFIRFLGVEILLWGFGILVMPAPSAIVAMMAIGSWLLVAERMLREDALSWLSIAFEEGIHRLETDPRTLAVWIAGLVTLTFVLAFGRPIERQLWRTGNWGEPPWNRCSLVSRSSDRSLVQFRATVTAVGPGIVVIYATKRPLGESQEKWQIVDQNGLPVRPIGPPNGSSEGPLNGRILYFDDESLFAGEELRMTVDGSEVEFAWFGSVSDFSRVKRMSRSGRFGIEAAEIGRCD